MENAQPKKRRRLTDEEKFAKEAEKEKKAKDKQKVIGKKIENKKTTRINKQNFLFGAAVREEAGRNPDFKRLLYGLMHKFLTREYDRTFFTNKDTDPFVLPPLPDKKDDKKGG